jgi:hypothetical protein
MDRSVEIGRMISTFVEEVNIGHLHAALKHFTSDATIVEDIAPFRWQGPGAGGEWLTAMAANAERLNVSSVAMQLGPPKRIEVAGSTAYAIFDGVVLLDTVDTQLREVGSLTFALERRSQQWLIAALIWTGERPS